MLIPIFVVSCVTLCAFGLWFVIVLRRSTARICDPLAWLDDFSAGAYRPMERLLDTRDNLFLTSQAGYQPAIGRRLRRQRMAIFQSYLAGMISDFHRLLGVAKVITVYTSRDQTAFESRLSTLRWRFYLSVLAIEWGVVLNVIGIHAVDPRRLLASIERLEVYTQSLIPAPEQES